MYKLKVHSELSLSYWLSRSNFQQQVVRHAICYDSAWYAAIPLDLFRLTHLHCTVLSIAGIICQHLNVLCESSSFNIHFASLYLDLIDTFSVKYV
jgi:hypothetical protein